MSREVTAAELRARLEYNPMTGDFFWISARTNSRRPGSNLAGALTNGYRQISVDRRLYKAHRLAWLYMTGSAPDGEIDHINGITDDNRWNNLRCVDSSTNKENRHVARSDSKSGLIGAHHHRTHGWRSSIKVKGVCLHLGYFETAQAAHEAYMEAKRQHHQGCTA